MSIFLGILLAIFVFLLIVLIHEFGHFITARLTGMKVEEFGFGIPPKIAKIHTDKYGTDFTWNLLPIGGFVRIFGEDPTGEHAHDAWAFMTKPWASRALVLVAGVTMNFLLAWFVFSFLFFSGAKPLAVVPMAEKPTHSFFLPSFSEALDAGYVTYSGVSLSPLTGSIAEKSGLKPHDILVSLDGKHVDSLDAIASILEKNTQVTLKVKRWSGEVNIALIPKDGKVWMYMQYEHLKVDTNYEKKYNLSESFILGARETYNSSVMTLSFLGDMLHGLFAPKNEQEHTDAKNMLSWPIGVGYTFVNLVEISAPLGVILTIIALLSINLGVINLLPFPALDGGRLFTTTLYAVFLHVRKWTKKFLTFEKYFHALGFILLLVLMLYVAGLDISRFF